MIVSLADAKNFLRVDFTDDDVLIQTLIDMSENHLLAATGIQLDSTNAMAATIVLMLIAEVYSNREIARQIDAGANSLINSLITQLAYSRASVVGNAVQVPSGLTAMIDENGNMLIRWLDNLEPNVDGYNVYRGGVKVNTDLIREDSDWTEWPLAWGDWPYPVWRSGKHDHPGVMQFYDTTAQTGQTYGYQVSAVDTLGNETALSNTVQVTT